MIVAKRMSGLATLRVGLPLFGPTYRAAMVLTSVPVESAEWRSGVGGSARSADGEDCLRPAGPSSAAARLREHAREVRRKAPARERRAAFFAYFLVLLPESKTPAGGGTPADERLPYGGGNEGVGLHLIQPSLPGLEPV